jgi:hypothetical protein
MKPTTSIDSLVPRSSRSSRSSAPPAPIRRRGDEPPDPG